MKLCAERVARLTQRPGVKALPKGLDKERDANTRNYCRHLMVAQTVSWFVSLSLFASTSSCYVIKGEETHENVGSIFFLKLHVGPGLGGEWKAKAGLRPGHWYANDGAMARLNCGSTPGSLRRAFHHEVFLPRICSKTLRRRSSTHTQRRTYNKMRTLFLHFICWHRSKILRLVVSSHRHALVSKEKKLR